MRFPIVIGFNLGFRRKRDIIFGAGENFDEHKVMLGFNTEAEARQGYLDNYSKDWKAPDVIPQLTMEEFKDWLKNGDTRKPYPTKSDARPEAVLTDNIGDLIYRADDLPYPTEAAAQRAAQARNLEQSHRVIEVEDGYVLAPIEPKKAIGEPVIDIPEHLLEKQVRDTQSSEETSVTKKPDSSIGSQAVSVGRRNRTEKSKNKNRYLALKDIKIQRMMNVDGKVVGITVSRMAPGSVSSRSVIPASNSAWF